MLLACLAVATFGVNCYSTESIFEHWRDDSSNKIRAASVFGSTQNHIFVYYGSISGLALILRDTYLDLGGLSSIRFCFSWDQPQLLDHFQNEIKANDDSTLKTVILFGLESLFFSGSSVNAESASVLDILYMVSDKSSPFHNVNIFILLKRPISEESELSIDDVLMTGLNQYSSVKFNARSFIGRITAIIDEPFTTLLYKDAAQSEDIVQQICNFNHTSIHRRYGVVIFLLVCCAAFMNIAVLFWRSPNNLRKFNGAIEGETFPPLLKSPTQLPSIAADTFCCKNSRIEKNQEPESYDSDCRILGLKNKPSINSGVKRNSKRLRNRKSS